MSAPPTHADRLTTLIEHKLADLEDQVKAGEVPSTADLNGARRLIEWIESERVLAESRELTTPTGSES